MMKKIFILVLTGVMFLLGNGVVFAGEYTYRPEYTGGGNDPYATGNLNDDNYDLGDLDHGKAYEWKIDARDILNNGETIIGASLFFNDIKNHDNSNNILYVNLLNYNNDSNFGVNVSDDDSNGNYFSGNSSYSSNSLFTLENLAGSFETDIRVEITNESQSNVPIGDQETVNMWRHSHTIGATLDMPGGGLSNLIEYASDGIFGLGFDPDCHFYNNGITLKLTTTGPDNTVPEPATLMLFGAGLLCFASRMRKKKQA